MPRHPPKLKRRIQIKIMEVAPQPPEASDDDASSVSSDSSENLDAVMADIKRQMHAIYVATKAAQTQVTALFQRAKEETTEWMIEPMRARSAVRPWLEAHGLSATPTLEDFINACMDAALTTDLETRTLTFKAEDAAILWKGQRRITVFQMLAAIPALFHT